MPKTKKTLTLKDTPQSPNLNDALDAVPPVTSHSHSPALGDLIIGHNNFVAHPTVEGLYIGAITKTPAGYKGRKFQEPVSATIIRLGNVPMQNHNAIKRSSIAQVRFVILHDFEQAMREIQLD